jgi:hypothetical protein
MESQLVRMLTAPAKGDEQRPEPTPTPVAPASGGSERLTPLPPERLAGDLALAMTSPWLALVSPDSRYVLALYAKTRITFGKLREPPIDVCLRNYPAAELKDDCLKVSRQHLAFAYDLVRAALTAEDLGSGNGTALGGKPLLAGAPRVLDTAGAHELVVAGVVRLAVRVTPRGGPRRLRLDGAVPSAGGFPCGIDTDHALDALGITRPANRTGMAYALVLRRITIGGAGAGLALPGVPPGPQVELALYNGRWIHRGASGGDWKPLAVGDQLKLGNVTLAARAGHFDDFQ